MGGYYRYSDAFQILECKSNSERTGKYLDIEYDGSYGKKFIGAKKKKSDAPEYAEQRERERAHLNLLKELTALVSIITNQPCEIHFNKEMNILPDTQEEISEFSDVSNKHKIRLDPHRIIQRQNTTRSFVMIHPEADKFFDNYFRLDEKARERYNASIFLYQGMRKILLSSASMAIIGLISSIENLVEFEGERNNFERKSCKCCGSPIYKINSRFKDFMLKYSEFEFEVDKAKSLLNKFYSKRSKISHAGAILEIDRLISTFSMAEYREFNEIEAHVRIALFNYLLKYNFKEDVTDEIPAV